MNVLISTLIKYILKYYPHKSELSASRVTKMLYLADWKNAIENGTQITDVVWHFNHYGPYVDEFIETARKDEEILVTNATTVFGGRKQQLELSNKFKDKIDISQSDKEILDFVINATKDKNYDDFIKLVYSTYPVLFSEKYSDLDLVTLAHNYKSIKSSH
ncbi:Panacea domain-containing protein [Shewanella algae]|uniref:Panacea domain-containing protein n=1 Tax=Shewanella algae TaxID=38313 RepID=UPI003D7D0244